MSRPQPALLRSITLPLVAGAAAAGLVTGCSSPSPTTSPSPSISASPSTSSSQSDNVARLCAASDAFASALTDFKDTLRPDATVEQLRSARDEVVKAYNDLIEASGKVAQERAAAVVAAEEQFVAAVNAVAGQATLPQAVETLRTEAAKVQAAVTDLRSDAKC